MSEQRPLVYLAIRVAPDPLGLANKSEKSYWTPHEPVTELESYRRQT